MTRKALPRRIILKGAAHGLAAAVALPTLEAMLNGNGDAYAQNEPLPVRFGVWYWGSGVRKNRFFPQATGNSWESTAELAPLEPYRSEFNILGGYSIKEGGIVHHIGTAVLKTGQGYIDLGGNFNTDVRRHSFDLDVAEHLSHDTPFPAMHVGVYSDGVFNGEGINTRALSHNGQGSPNMADTSPQSVFDRMFGVVSEQPGPGVASYPAPEHRQSVLDLVRGQATSLRQRLGVADQARIDEHLEAIRGIERRLEAEPPSQDTTCSVPASPGVGEPGRRNPDMILHNELMVDLTAMALACDLTRVFTFRHHGWTDDPVLTELLGANDRHHNLTHNEGGEQPIVHAHNVFTMQQLAKMIDRFQNVSIGGGNLLDYTGIMAYSEVGEGWSHSLDDIPILTIGRAGGALRTGIYHRSNARDSVTKVNLTMMRAVGMEMPSWGVGPHQVSDPIAEIMG